KRRADRIADRADLGRACDLLELWQQVRNIGLSQIRSRNTVLFAALFENVRAGEARTDAVQTCGGRSDFGFGRRFRQLDHDLFQRDVAGGGTGTLVTHIDDVDTAFDEDRVR